MNLAFQITVIVVLAVFSLGAYYLLRNHVMVKYTFKKRHLLPALALIIIGPVIFSLFNPNSQLPAWLYMLQMVLFTIIFLMYAEILKRDRLIKMKLKAHPISKPKPKPNRVKNKM